MALLVILINFVAVLVNYGKTDVSGFAVVSLIISIIAYGIFHNFRNDAQNAPEWAVFVSTGSGIVGIILIIIGITR